MKKNLKSFKLFLAVGLVATLTACSLTTTSDGGEDDEGIISEHVERGEGIEGATIPSDVLPEFADNVVIPTYVELVAQAKNLKTGVDAFVANPTADSLNAAQEMWSNARLSWEKSAAFAFGPAEALGFDGDLDGWPVNEVDVQAILDSSDVITDEYITGLQTTQKGYNAIEMVLFGKTADKTVDAFTSRELELLSALVKNFERTADGLLTSWTDGVDGNPAYREMLATAGNPDNPAYPTLNAAAEEIVQGIMGCLTEVGEEKIGDPLAIKSVGEFESQFSQTTLNVLHNNLISAQNAYLGMLPNGSASTNSISSLIESVDASLDADIKIQFETALSLIETVPIPIKKTQTDAQFKTTLVKAQETIVGLNKTFEDKVLPII